MDKRELIRIIKAIIIAVIVLCIFEFIKSESIIKDQIDHSGEPVPETKEEKETWEELLDAFSSGSGAIMLSQVTEALDGEDIQYTGYYNQSLERIDMTLEDGTELLFLSTAGSEGEKMEYELMMVNGELDSNCFQEDYLNEYDVTTDEFYYPDFSERLWEYDELHSFDAIRLSIARNQIFAKHGREFQDRFLRAVFERKSWYHSELTAKEFNERQQELLTDMEKKNLETVLQFETDYGRRKNSDDNFDYAKRLLSGSYLDLDKDGQKEQIIYKILEEDGTGYFAFAAELCIRGTEGETSKVLEGEGLWTECFAASMGDQYTYLIVSVYGDSADYVSTFYRYDKGSLTNVGSVLSHPAAIMFYPDRITGKEREYHFQTQEIEKEYAFENGKLVSKEKDYYEYTKNIVTADQKIALYPKKDESDAMIMISRGDEVQVMGGDLEQWVQLKKVSTGEMGWLKVNENDICYLPDGTEISAWDLFEDRIIYD